MALRAGLWRRLGDVMPFFEKHLVLAHSPFEATPPQVPGGRGSYDVPRNLPLAMAPVWNGALAQTADLGVVPYITGLKNLTLTGDQILPSLGIEGALVAGWSAAKVACALAGKKKDYLRDEVVGAALSGIQHAETPRTPCAGCRAAFGWLETSSHRLALPWVCGTSRVSSSRGEPTGAAASSPRVGGDRRGCTGLAPSRRPQHRHGAERARLEDHSSAGRDASSAARIAPPASGRHALRDEPERSRSGATTTHGLEQRDRDGRADERAGARRQLVEHALDRRRQPHARVATRSRRRSPRAGRGRALRPSAGRSRARHRPARHRARRRDARRSSSASAGKSGAVARTARARLAERQRRRVAIERAGDHGTRPCVHGVAPRRPCLEPAERGAGCCGRLRARALAPRGDFRGERVRDRRPRSAAAPRRCALGDVASFATRWSDGLRRAIPARAPALASAARPWRRRRAAARARREQRRRRRQARRRSRRFRPALARGIALPFEHDDRRPGAAPAPRARRRSGRRSAPSRRRDRCRRSPSVRIGCGRRDRSRRACAYRRRCTRRSRSADALRRARSARAGRGLWADRG